MKRNAGWLIPFVPCLALFNFACASSRGHGAGLVEGRLRPCPKSPNCVCSEEEAKSSHIAPIRFAGDPAAAWCALKDEVTATGGEIVTEQEAYLHATFRTRIFRFVDDLECRLDREAGVIHVRSASRLGWSDLGVNRRRVEALRERFSRRTGSGQEGG